jgi:hypothetical protein
VERRKGLTVNSFSGKQVLSALTLVVVVTATTLVVPADGTFNEQSIPRNYFGVPLDIRKAKDVDRVPLGTIIFTPPQRRKATFNWNFLEKSSPGSS